MPPKKRALEETDANAQDRAPKSSKHSHADQVENAPSVTEVTIVDDSVEDAEVPKDPFKGKKDSDYICIDRPLEDFEAEIRGRNNEGKASEDGNDHDAEDEPELEDEEEEEDENAFKAYVAARSGSNSMHNKIPSEHPEWKWTMMIDTWKMYVELVQQASYRDPDNFNMHIYNDSHGYGISALIGDQFDKEYKKKDRNLEHTWATIASLLHFISRRPVVHPWIMIDDGEGTESTIGLIGCALLSVIEAIEHAGELRPESKFRDLALVMSLYLAFAENARAMFCWEEMTRSERVVGYAKKGGLDLKARGRHGMKAILEGLGDVAPIQKRKVGMWMWSANLREHKKEHALGGGLEPQGGYDITKWTRKQRAQASFDGVDPLADVPEKDLKEGNLFFN